MQDNRKEIAHNAKGFAKTGFTIFEVEGKRPKKGLKWRQAPYILPSDVEEFFSHWEGNYGIAPNRQQLVIDVDPRNFEPGDSPIKRLIDLMEVEPKTFTKVVQTGGGGLHLFLRLPDLPEGKKVRKNHPEYKGIDFISEGAYVVGAGSQHPETGQIYKVLQDNPIVEAPASLVDLILMDAVETKNLPALIDTVDDAQTVHRFLDYLSKAPVAVEGDSGDKQTFLVSCKGKELGLSPEDTFDMMAEHYNPKCSPMWSLEELKLKVSNAYEYSSNPLGMANPQADFAEVPVDPKAIRHPDWRGWQTAPGTTIKLVNSANAYNYFINYHETDSPLHDALAFNEFTGAIVKIKIMPWDAPHATLEKYGNPWTDSDYNGLTVYFSRVCKFNPPQLVIRTVVSEVAKLQRFHPIRDYLNSLKWDGVPRLETWLTDNSGAAPSATHKAISKMLFMQAVDRIYHPGCQCDTVVVLEGDQGIYKTTLVKLLGGEYYADIVIDPDRQVDTLMAMDSYWIIEMSEMITFKKKDYDSLKRFITQTRDVYRKPYGSIMERHMRQSILISTVNPDATGQYLSDPTGNRRFSPISLGSQKIDIPAIAAIRDQLFAEATHRLLTLGEKSYITDHQTLKLLKDEQARRTAVDSYMEMIEEYLSDKVVSGVSSSHIWIYALGGNKSSLHTGIRRRIVTCLQELGYHQGSARVKGVTKNLYIHKGNMEATKQEGRTWLV